MFVKIPFDILQNQEKFESSGVKFLKAKHNEGFVEQTNKVSY